MSEPMLRVYFDASALVKRYSQELGTALVNEVFRLLPVERMTCSMLSVVEVVSILVRKRNDGRLKQDQFEHAIAKFRAEVIDAPEFSAESVDDDLLMASLDLVARHNLNATDCAILRSALDLRSSLTLAGEDLLLCTSDRRLARAATDEGIKVFNPEKETEDTLRQLLGVDQQSSEQ